MPGIVPGVGAAGHKVGCVRRSGPAARLGGLGKTVAGLLVLALLALTALPASAWSPAPEKQTRHAALDQGPHGDGVSPTRHGHDGDHPPGGYRDTHPALACCVAMYCPMLTGDLPGAPALPLPPPGPPIAEPVAPRRLAGFSLPPALPPPRAA